jgi:DNA mismatch repair ATPase MutS
MRTKRDRKRKADTSHVASAPQSTMNTKGKRKIAEIDATNATLAPQSTADMAEVLRQRLVATHEAQRKNRRILKRRTINLNAINPVLNLIGFFKLDREIRDQIHQMLWSETTQIHQRYKRRVYNVTYGDVTFEELQQYRRSKFKVCCLVEVFERQNVLNTLSVIHADNTCLGTLALDLQANASRGLRRIPPALCLALPDHRQP